MSEIHRFAVDQADDRVVLVPEFWPSDLPETDRRRYEALADIHQTEDGALSIPRSDLHELAPESGGTVTLDDVWEARGRRARRAYDGLVYPSNGLLDERDRIAWDLLE